VNSLLSLSLRSHCEQVNVSPDDEFLRPQVEPFYEFIGHYRPRFGSLTFRQDNFDFDETPNVSRVRLFLTFPAWP